MSSPGTPIKQGATEPIEAMILDASLAPLANKTDILVKIRRKSDGLTYDWDDSTFKAYGSCTTPLQTMTAVDNTNYPGEYARDWTSPSADEIYEVTVVQSPGTDAANVPQNGEIRVGGWVDDVDAAVSSRAAPGDAMDLVADAVDSSALATTGVDEIRDSILSDSTPFAGANIDQSLSTTESNIRGTDGDDLKDLSDEIAALENLSQAQAQAAAAAALTAYDPPTKSELDAVETNLVAEHDATQIAIAALNDLSQADVQAAMTAQGYTSARAPGLDNLDATVSSRAAPGDAMTLTAGERTAIDGVLSTAHGSGGWEGVVGQDWTSTEREQIRFRLAMDGTQADPTTSAGTLEEILADTDAVDGRLPVDPADESLQQAAHAATQLAIAALNDLDQAGVQAAMTAQGYTSVRGGLLDNLADLDASITSVLAAIAGLNDLDQAGVQAAMTAQGYTTARAALIDNLINLDVLLSGIPASVDTVLTAAHGVGSWITGVTGTDWTTAEKEAIRQALGVPGTKAGAVDGQLQDVLTDTAAIDGRLPSDPADESIQQAQHAATQAAISALEDLSSADVQTACVAALDAQGYSPGRAGNLDDLDVAVSTRASSAELDAAEDSIKGVDDRDLSELAGAGWATTDTLEGIRDAVDGIAAAGGYNAADRARDDQVAVETAAIDGRLPSDPADESLQQAAHAATQAAVAALENLSQAGVQAAMTAQGYTTARAGFVELSKKVLINELDMSDGDTDNVVILDDDDATPLLTFDATDKNGDPVVLPPGAPARRSRGQ